MCENSRSYTVEYYESRPSRDGQFDQQLRRILDGFKNCIGAKHKERYYPVEIKYSLHYEAFILSWTYVRRAAVDDLYIKKLKSMVAKENWSCELYIRKAILLSVKMATSRVVDLLKWLNPGYFTSQNAYLGCLALI